MRRVFGLFIFIGAIIALIILWQNREAVLGFNKLPKIFADARPVSLTGIKVPPPPKTAPRKTGGATGGTAISAPSSGGSVVAAPKPTPPVFHTVLISGVYRYTYPRPYSEVTLYSNSNTPLDITGWKIKSNTDSFLIPQGMEYYPPVYDPAANTDIMLKKGDRIILYSNASPIGANFKTNKCIGYIVTSSNLAQSIPVTCPSIDYTKITNLSGACQNYVRNLGFCKLPESIPSIPYEPACYDFLRTVGYTPCFNEHRFDKDFLGTEWRAWLGDAVGNQRVIFDSSHDRVQLLTGGGALVDEYVY